MKPKMANQNTKKLTRKELRKQNRKEKKIKRNNYFSKKKILPSLVQSVNETKTSNKTNDGKKHKEALPKPNKPLTSEQLHRKEKKAMEKLQLEMKEQRSKQLLEANKEEDKIIRQMEKRLGLKKRKSKSLPKDFSEDGLDFLLEVMDPKYLSQMSQKGLDDADDNFEEDFDLITKKNALGVNDENSTDGEADEEEEIDEPLYSHGEDEEIDELLDSHDEEEEIDAPLDSQDEEEEIDEPLDSQDEGKEIDGVSSSNDDNSTNDEMEEESDKEKNISDDSDAVSEEFRGTKRKTKKLIKTQNKIQKTDLPKTNSNDKSNKCKNIDEDSDQSFSDHNSYDHEYNSEVDEIEEMQELPKGAVKTFSDGTWEDIYGRLRGKDGSIITKDKHESKYVPPALRGKPNQEGSNDKQRQEKLGRLKKQLKGLLNRLAGPNMHGIATQIEELYMNNSRNDMNDTLTNLLCESLISTVITPERLIQEHVVLIAVLHANVGTEVGAHFLQYMVKEFDYHFKLKEEVENKTLNNIIRVLAQLYNFKIFDSKLMFEILQKLASNFKEKEVECILHILRSVGFVLRKSDPLALKELILELQNKAAICEERENARVKFMLEILLAIRNNNVRKIPNYDISYSEHLKKMMKGFIRKGNDVMELNISLEDLLKAEEKGKWWVVGSAWTGNGEKNPLTTKENLAAHGFSEKILELARQQRMNTDVRKNIFCVIMAAEDYLDAFEKLMKLGLKHLHEREIVNVTLHCCQHEKEFNPYYAYLAQKFCEYDRRFQLMIKYSLWDKLKTINNQTPSHLSKLAKLLIHLFMEKSLPISTLKVIEFSELDKVTLRFVRQILLGILLHEDVESSLAVFARVSQGQQLRVFRESLRLFIHHFLLRNLKGDKIPEDQKQLLEVRAKMVDKLLSVKEMNYN